MTLLPLLAAALITLGAYILKKRGKSTSVYVKAAALTLAAVTFARYIYEHVAIYNMFGLNHASSPFNADGANPILTALAVILVWFSYAALLTTVVSEFFE